MLETRMLSATDFKHILWLLVAVAVALQWVVLHISRLHLEPQWEAVSSGLNNKISGKVNNTAGNGLTARSLTLRLN